MLNSNYYPIGAAEVRQRVVGNIHACSGYDGGLSAACMYVMTSSYVDLKTSDASKTRSRPSVPIQPRTSPPLIPPE